METTPDQFSVIDPLLEHKGVILNDISFDEDVCLLTGPNMGGKSTFLKTLSMVTLYAQIGCYVPSKKAILPVFDKIFMAVKEYLIKLGSKTVLATHFSQVGDDRTLNKKMCVMDNILTCKVEDGTTDSSFGLKVAEMAGFPDDVLEKAEEYLNMRTEANKTFI